MIVKFFCDKANDRGIRISEDCFGDVASGLQELARTQKELWLRVCAFLKNLASIETVDGLPCYVERLEQERSKGSLYVMQVPKTRQGGCFCIYFCKYQERDDSVVFLCSELKQGRLKNMNRAKQLLNEYCKMVKGK
ncbi:hypothetical protein [Fibrobacter sp. UWEL]|uniref:hypothetical protein n=1 Tax=Fibrobacter sp. UWEL TaxID=1896209 RepID=UPI0009118FA3|nr:hypothetical protein [Fibrobacter sp. UWEL]SHL34429.1 hypothetical protein SAMN05720468_1235 [Fibrobacter sp. UWEL]